MRWLRFFSRVAEPLRTPLDEARYEANEAAKRLINHLDSIPMNSTDISVKNVQKEIVRQEAAAAEFLESETPRNAEERKIAAQLVELIKANLKQCELITIHSTIEPSPLGSSTKIIITHPMNKSMHRPDSIFPIRANVNARSSEEDTKVLAYFLRRAVWWEAQNPVDMVSPPKE